MTFTTLTFALFVALVFGLYWGARTRQRQNVVLLAASYAFYAWWDWRLCGLLLSSSVVDYLVARALDDGARRRGALLGLSCVTNLGLLGTFKYYDFFVDALVAAASSLGLDLSVAPLRLLLPVGISFYTFQTLGYTIDVYRRELPATRDPIAYLAYVSFFPQLVAGPIERGARLLLQFAVARTFDRTVAVDGLRQMAWGFVQKVALADNLAIFVDAAYADGSHGLVLSLATFAFAFQIYWDFCGYSNLAVGTAKLLGIRLSRNFAYPYFAQQLADFWRRWHMTLSTWFRDYVYRPLGGNRRGTRRQIVAIIVTFALSGLWHGAAWHFVVWGGLSGVLALPSILSGPRRPPPARLDVRSAIAMLRTFTLASVGWIFFRAPSLDRALAICGAIVTDLASPAARLELDLYADHVRALFPLVGIVVVVEWLSRTHEHPLQLHGWPRPFRWLLYTLLVWTTLYLTPESPTRFIYFQF